MSINKIAQLALSALIAFTLVLSAGPSEARGRRDRSRRVRIVNSKPKKIRSNGRTPKKVVKKRKSGRRGNAHARTVRTVRRPAKTHVRKVVKRRGKRHHVSHTSRRRVVTKRHGHPRPVIIHTPRVRKVRRRRHRPAPRAVVVHHRRPTAKVVHVHRRPASRTVVVYDDTPEAVSVETTEAVAVYSEPEVDAYLGAGLQTFTPSLGFAPTSSPEAMGLNVHAGLRFDDTIAVEMGWTGTATGSRNGMQAGTIDAKAFLNDGTFRPYVLVGAGVFALQDAELTGGTTMTGPGIRLGAGLEVGDSPLTVNVGATWQGMALSAYDSGPEELELSGVSVGAGLALNF